MVIFKVSDISDICNLKMSASFTKIISNSDIKIKNGSTDSVISDI